MDIEKQIEQLNGYFDGKTLTRGAALDAATALSTLQAENAQLRAELEQKEKYYEQMVDALAATESAELEQVKRERDAAVNKLARVCEDNKKLCAAMINVKKYGHQSQMRVVYELYYDAALSHQDVRYIAGLVFDGLMREDMRQRGRKEDEHGTD